jgi:hypothetical protein
MDLKSFKRFASVKGRKLAGVEVPIAAQDLLDLLIKVEEQERTILHQEDVCLYWRGAITNTIALSEISQKAIDRNRGG